MLEIYTSISDYGKFNPEKADIFSLGISFIRFCLIEYEIEISGLNN